MRILRTLRFYRMPAQLPAADATLPAIATRWIDALSDLPEELRSRVPHHAEYSRRFALGHRLFLLLDSGECAHWSWVARTRLRIDEIAYEWRIPGDHRCIFDVETSVPHRGKGLYLRSLLAISGELRAAAVTGIWIYAEAENVASVRGIEKAGFLPAGSVRALCVGRRVVRLGSVQKVLA